MGELNWGDWLFVPPDHYRGIPDPSKIGLKGNCTQNTSFFYCKRDFKMLENICIIKIRQAVPEILAS